MLCMRPTIAVVHLKDPVLISPTTMDQENMNGFIGSGSWSISTTLPIDLELEEHLIRKLLMVRYAIIGVKSAWAS